MMKRKFFMKGFGRILFLSVVLLFCATGVFAQKVTVTGTIKDSDQQVIPGATIIEKGTTNGTVSNAYMYFNYYNTIKKLELEPLANSNSLPLKKVYDYHFLPKQLSDNEKQFIIGLQACLWTEYVKTEKQVEALTFPRLCAMSECAWTPQKLKHYDSFYNRLITNIKHLEKIDINYSPLFLNPVNNNY
jgi:N-acetyl-beta-hexosaminidase